MVDRRTFIATTAAAAVLLALPAVGEPEFPTVMISPIKPKMGSGYVSGAWVEAETKAAAMTEAFNYCETVIHRVGRERGVIFGRRSSDAEPTNNPGEWFVVIKAVVVGYV